MPPLLGIIVIPTERVIKTGATITLYNPEVAVADALLGQLGPEPPVGTPTIRVRPGKYTIAFGGMVHSHPTGGDVQDPGCGAAGSGRRRTRPKEVVANRAIRRD